MVGLSLDDSLDALVENSSILTTESENISGINGWSGISLVFSRITLRGNRIFGGNGAAGATSDGIVMVYSEANVVGNVIYAAHPMSADASIQTDAIGMRIQASPFPLGSTALGDERLIIAGNLFLVNIASGWANGIYCQDRSMACDSAPFTRTMLVFNNTFILDNDVNQVGLSMPSSCMDARNNLIVARRAGVASRGIVSNSSILGSDVELRTNLIANPWVGQAGKCLAELDGPTCIVDDGDGNIDAELLAGGGVNLAAGNITVVLDDQAADPLAPIFMDAPNGDFRLTPGSPARAAGENLATHPDLDLVVDLGGVTWPAAGGGNWSIGAYQ